MSPEAQRRSALRKANKVRSRHARLKAALRSGRISLADCLLDEKTGAQTMRVRDLLLATPNVGPVKTDRTLRACHLGPRIAAGCLPESAKHDLLAYLAERAPSLDLGEWKVAA